MCILHQKTLSRKICYNMNEALLHFAKKITDFLNQIFADTLISRFGFIT